MFDFLLIVLITTALAMELPCRYVIGTVRFDTSYYYCELNNSLDIPNPTIQITSVTGGHADQKSNADVEGFRVDNKTLHFLPRGLENYFEAEKIKFIELQSTGLKEIHQIDLKPFTKLKFFSAWKNELLVLEHDLFKYNPELTFVGLGKNKIRAIYGNIFKNLNHLDTVYLDGNLCIGKYVNGKESVDYKNELLILIKDMWSDCAPHS